jgi:hypothetical protein
MSQKEISLPTEYILVVEMITVTVFYRITWKTISSKGGSYIEAVTMRKLMAWRSLLTAMVRNREHLTMEGFNMESMFG